MAGIIEISIIIFVLNWLFGKYFRGFIKNVILYVRYKFIWKTERIEEMMLTANGIERYREHAMEKAMNGQTCSSDVNTDDKPSCCPICAIRYTNQKEHSMITSQKYSNMLKLPEKYGFHIKLYKDIYHNFISLEHFLYPRIGKEMLEDNRVRKAISRAIKMEYLTNNGLKTEDHDNISTLDRVQVPKDIMDKEEKKFKKETKSILKKMASKLSDMLLRLTSYVLYKLLPYFLSGVMIKPEQLQFLHKVERSGIPIMILPNHRSHLDYIMMTFIMMNHGIKAPIVAAGDNLMIPVFGWLLRGLGAFYIKRKIDPAYGQRDFVYRGILQTYMERNLKLGNYMEFFLEGTRTRTGKTCVPKGGLLSVIIDTHKAGLIPEALLVPVSINYEKLVDGNFVREQLGDLKKKETFLNACRSIWKIITAKYGECRVDFCPPYSLSELIDSFHNKCAKGRNGKSKLARNSSLPINASFFGTDVVVEDERHMVEDIAKTIIIESDRNISLMSTNVLSFLLLYKFRDGGRLSDIALELDKIRCEISKTSHECCQGEDSIEVINRAVDLLGDELVHKYKHENYPDEWYIEASKAVSSTISLSYYSNAVVPCYALDSVMATAIVSQLNGSTWNTNNVETVTREATIFRTYELCKLLQFEFFFLKPCEFYIDVLSQKFSQFVNDKMLISETGDVSLNDQTLYKLNQGFADKYEFLCKILRPYFEGYAVCLEFIPSSLIAERRLLSEMRYQVQSKVADGIFRYIESMAADLLRNALKVYENKKFVECSYQGHEKFYKIHNELNNEDFHIECNRVESYICSVNVM